jgi:hypothetical protein
MSDGREAGFDWGTFPFDKEVVLNAIPQGAKTSVIHISVAPEPADGAVRVLGRMANGGTGCVTLLGNIYAAKLPFADRVIRLQYLGDTSSVGVRLESYAY